jgi:hypothetical protein
MMVPGYFTTLVVSVFLGWLSLTSLGFIAYLSWAKIQDIRRKRRMEAERQRLGLRPGAITRGRRQSILALARLANAAEPAPAGFLPCPRSRPLFQPARKVVFATPRLDPLGVMDGLRGRSPA